MEVITIMACMIPVQCTIRAWLIKLILIEHIEATDCNMWMHRTHFQLGRTKDLYNHHKSNI